MNTKEIGELPAKDNLSLRDYFAAKAIEGLLQSQIVGSGWVHDTSYTGTGRRLLFSSESLAAGAYQIADAMLAERSKS